MVAITKIWPETTYFCDNQNFFLSVFLRKPTETYQKKGSTEKRYISIWGFKLNLLVYAESDMSLWSWILAIGYDDSRVTIIEIFLTPNEC